MENKIENTTEKELSGIDKLKHQLEEEEKKIDQEFMKEYTDLCRKHNRRLIPIGAVAGSRFEFTLHPVILKQTK